MTGSLSTRRKTPRTYQKLTVTLRLAVRILAVPKDSHHANAIDGGRTDDVDSEAWLTARAQASDLKKPLFKSAYESNALACAAKHAFIGR
jgi:hypothetical protein